MMLNQDGTSLITYNETSESITFIDEQPMYPLEFAKNKLLVTGHPSQMYVIIDWYAVKFISEPNTANIYKNYAFLMPEFDEIFFPFIAVCGK